MNTNSTLINLKTALHKLRNQRENFSFILDDSNRFNVAECFRKNDSIEAIQRSLSTITVPAHGEITSIRKAIKNGDPNFALYALKFLCVQNQTDEIEKIIKVIILQHPQFVTNLVSQLLEVRSIETRFSLVEGVILSNVLRLGSQELVEEANVQLVATILSLHETPALGKYTSTVEALCEFFVINKFASEELIEILNFSELITNSIVREKVIQSFAQIQEKLIESVIAELL